jgi:hypothetical protein
MAIGAWCPVDDLDKLIRQASPAIGLCGKAVVDKLGFAVGAQEHGGHLMSTVQQLLEIADHTPDGAGELAKLLLAALKVAGDRFPQKYG